MTEYNVVPDVSTNDPWSADNHDLYIKGNFAHFAQLSHELKLCDSYAPISDIGEAPLSYPESSGAAPNPAWPILTFVDNAVTGRQWSFILDQKYESVTSANLSVHYYMAGANTNKDVVFTFRIAAISDGDASVTAKVFDTANVFSSTVPAAAGTEKVITIWPLLTADDDMVAGDRVILMLYRDTDAVADTAAGSCIVTGVELRFTA
jgi:hypothetical protein